MIQIYDIPLLNSKGCNNFQLSQENNYKLLHACDMWSYNISSYLIKCQSERYIIMSSNMQIKCESTTIKIQSIIIFFV